MAKKGKRVARAASSGRGRGRGGGGNPNKVDIEITLLATGGVSPDPAPTLSKSVKTRVRWINEADRGLTVDFVSAWPFTTAPEPIQIEAGKKSKWYTLHSTTDNGNYTYAIDPDLSSAGGPPGEPGFIVGG